MHKQKHRCPCTNMNVSMVNIDRVNFEVKFKVMNRLLVKVVQLTNNRLKFKTRGRVRSYQGKIWNTPQNNKEKPEDDNM